MIGVIASQLITPMDLYQSYLGAWSLFRLSIRYSGVVAYIRRSSDNAQTDVYYDANGKISLTSLVSGGGNLSDWAGASLLYVVTLYDLTGNGRHASMTADITYQPRLILNAMNGGAVVRFSGNQQLILAPALNTQWNMIFSLHNIPASGNRGVLFGNYVSAANTQNSALEKNASNFSRIFLNGADLLIGSNTAFCGQVQVYSFVRQTSPNLNKAYLGNTLSASNSLTNGSVTNIVAHGIGADRRSSIPASAIGLTGDIGTIMVAEETFDESHRRQVATYLGKCGGLTL